MDTLGGSYQEVFISVYQGLYWWRFALDGDQAIGDYVQPLSAVWQFYKDIESFCQHLGSSKKHLNGVVLSHEDL